MFYIRYIGAFIYDGIILLALFFLFTTLCLCYRHGVAVPPSSAWYQLSLIFIFFIYYFLSHRHGGQTIGMRAWRLKLVSINRHLSWKQIVARFILWAPALICGVLSVKRSRRLLNDWTGSQIIRLD